jgi:selenocysteine-specific elongation factor
MRLLIGTREVMYVPFLSGQRRLNPGRKAFLQLRMEQEQVIVKERDRFICVPFRRCTRLPAARYWTPVRRNTGVLRRIYWNILKARDEGNHDEVIADFLHHKSSPFTVKEELMAYTHLDGNNIDIVLEQLLASGVIRETPLGYIHEEAYKAWRGKALQLLLDYHRKYPLRAGMPDSEFVRVSVHRCRKKKCRN